MCEVSNPFLSLWPLQGADPGSGDILLVDPCILRGEGEQAVKDHVKETAFEVLHRLGVGQSH